MDKHIPVLKNEVVECFDYLKNLSGGVFVDGTLGNGGHSIAIAKQFKIQNLKFKIIGIDKDKSALKLAEKNIREAGLYDSFILVNDDFSNIKQILADNNIDKIDGAMLDLGVSSMQLDQKERGFSFADLNARLDMRMDQNQELDAVALLNHYPEERLEKILKEYGEEKFSRKIAKNICEIRRNKHIENVGDLIYILEKSIPTKIRKTSKTHFATRTFQAIRIEINKELENLESAIDDFANFLTPGSRLAIITFHSLEDRIVKNKFRELASSCSCPPNAPICVCDKQATVRLINNKPMVAGEAELKANPRSRSAKLRIVEKIN
jgi:16S rRNA (cytosine1402-N4)-methyltransferase